MSLESTIIKKIFKQENQTPFKVIFKDGEVLNIGEGEAKFLIYSNKS